MKKKKDAQVFLEQHEKWEEIIKNKCSEWQMWRDLATSITANMGGERVQSSGTMSRMADAVERCIEAEAEIAESVRELRRQQKQIVETIEQLNSPMEYKLLHDKYIKHLSYHQIAEKYGKDYSWATTMHGRAIRNVQAILDRK